MKFACTPVPARRISTNGKVELRIAAEEAVRVDIQAQLSDRTVDCGSYAICPHLELNKIVPNTEGIVGPFVFVMNFRDEAGNLLGSLKQHYEIVASSVHSTCLLDGCWVTLYHWSEQEAHYYNKGLKNLTEDQWRQQVHDMHDIGVTSILIQNVFDSPYYVNQHDKTAETYDGRAFYDSKLYPGRVPITAEDPIEAILSAADECDMAVFPGVGLYAWFDFSEESLKWHKAVATELFERYGHHPSFYGFYLSEEIMGALYYGYDPVPDDHYKEIQHFMKEFQAFIHTLHPTMPLALAPNNIRMHCYKEQWMPILKHLDIIIPFAFARSENNIAQIAEMCKEAGTHFWVDMEIFDFPFDDGLRPKNYEKLIHEIHQYDMLEQVYGYQYTGLLNAPGRRWDLGMEETEELYEKYQAYEKKVREK